MEKKSRIIICGAGGSGKDYLKKNFINKGFKPSISYTTRPCRENEINGIDYHFISNENFQLMISNGEFYEYKEFKGWHYGTSLKDFEESDIFIMTPLTIDEMPKDIRETSFIIYINIPEHIRAKRLSYRNDADDIKRRVLTDRELFKCFTDYDLIINDPIF